QIIPAPTNFTAVSGTCRNIGASVVSIHNKQENDFIRNMAVSMGLINGLMLGASFDEQSKTFKWSDGSSIDYNNFSPGFPIDGLGDCVAMETNNANGPWINIECSTPLPFACDRQHSVDTAVCTGGLSTEGDLIFSPGFPNDASIPCDFILKVDPGMRVQAEVLFLEANSCCDHLVLYEGTLGGAVIADLTGEVSGKGHTYNTTSQNFMRASWQPKGGVNVKGMMV
ncbi:hypothetical protein PFISCL1PPCAC_11896, partial [Pristionchus fissidentatus]